MEEEDNSSEDIKSEDLLYNKLTYDTNKSKQNGPSDIKGSLNNEKGDKSGNNQKNKNTKSNSNVKSKKKNSRINENSKSPYKKESKSPNKNNNITKKNTSIPKPFEILDIQTSPYKKIKIKINACSFLDEYMMPIWCNKNTYIKFKVEGKWKIGKLYEFTDSRGMPSNQSSGFNYGALIGRVGLEEKKFITFVIGNDSCILIKEEGPLFLRRHLPKKLKIEPEGKLEISVYDGEYMKYEEINKKIGWKENGEIEENFENENNVEKNNNKKNAAVEEKELEKNIFKQLNNLRMNPTKFYEKYINTKLLDTKEFLTKTEKNEKIDGKNGKNKNDLKNEKYERIPLTENIACYNFLEKYFKLPNQMQLKKNSNKNNLNENLLKIDEDIEYFLFEEIGQTVKAKTKMTQKNNPNDIILLYLLDKKFRTYIFSNHSQFLVIKTFKNFYSDFTLVIMAIALDKDYSK